MFQKRRFDIMLALLLTVILALTGCSSSPANKAADNAKAFADQKNFERAVQTLHSAERELGSNLGPKELKALTNAYGYIIIKIADNAKAEAEKGDFEKAFADLDSSNETINLPPGMSLPAEATEAVQSSRIEIAKKCLKVASEGKTLAISIKLFNVASKSVSMSDHASVTPELQKMFDNARVKITEGLAESVIKACEAGDITQATSTMNTIDNLGKNISGTQSDKVAKAKDILLTKQTQADINLRLDQAEQYLTSQSGVLSDVVVKSKRIYTTVAKIYDDPVYQQSITEEQKQRYNTIATSLSEMVKTRMHNSTEAQLKTIYGISFVPVPLIQ